MLRYIMIVQGEGRGHLTQSVAFREIMEKAGHQCTGVFTGSSKRRKIPDFYQKKNNQQLFTFRSPNFLRNKKNTHYLISISILLNIIIFPRYINSVFFINKKIKELRPDLIINFYEPLCGLWKLLFHDQTPLISIAHQYYYKKPGFNMKGKPTDLLAIRILHKVTSYGSDWLFAIHLCNDPAFGKTTVIPPLLRSEILGADVSNDGHICVYLLNHGLAEGIRRGLEKQPSLKIECFSDQPYKQELGNFTLFPISDELFIDSLKSSFGLMTTAGYESVAEAMFLEKPVLMVPVKGHFEQKLNSRLFASFKAGIVSDSFETAELLKFATQYQVPEGYKSWVLSASEMIPAKVESLVTSFKLQKNKL